MLTPQNRSAQSAQSGSRAVPADGRPRGLGFRRPPPRWFVPIIAAFVATVVWLVGAVAADVDVAVRTATGGTQQVGLVSVIVTALVVGYAAWGVRALLGRLPSGGERAWLVTCTVILLVSLVGALSGVTPSAVGVLVSEHVAVGAALALGLRRS